MSTEVHFNLRIPAELKQIVSDAARINGRSINAEAQHRLEESFVSSKTKDNQTIMERTNFK